MAILTTVGVTALLLILIHVFLYVRQVRFSPTLSPRTKSNRIPTPSHSGTLPFSDEINLQASLYCIRDMAQPSRSGRDRN